MEQQRPGSNPQERDPAVSRRLVVRGALSGAMAAAFIGAGWRVQVTQAQEATPTAVLAAPEGPVKIVALYGEPTDAAAFEAYYFETHVPLATQIPGFQRLETGLALSALDGGPLAFHRITELVFASYADLETALGSPEGQTAFADVANFATGGVTATLVAQIETISGQTDE